MATMVRCPCCYGRGVEPTYGPYFDHDGDNQPTGWKTCTVCRGAKEIVARNHQTPVPAAREEG